MPVDSRQITVDTYVLGGSTDHISSWRDCFRTLAMLGGTPAFVLARGGHTIVVSRPPGWGRSSYRTGKVTGTDADEWLANSTGGGDDEARRSPGRPCSLAGDSPDRSAASGTAQRLNGDPQDLIGATPATGNHPAGRLYPAPSVMTGSWLRLYLQATRYATRGQAGRRTGSALYRHLDDLGYGVPQWPRYLTARAAALVDLAPAAGENQDRLAVAHQGADVVPGAAHYSARAEGVAPDRDRVVGVLAQAADDDPAPLPDLGHQERRVEQGVGGVVPDQQRAVIGNVLDAVAFGVGDAPVGSQQGYQAVACSDGGSGISTG